MKCTYCGKEETLLYRCAHCGSYFCTDHCSPQNHNCPLGRRQRKVRLPNGRIVKFDKKRITRTISNRVKTWGKAKELSNVVVNIINEKYPDRILELKDIHNVVNGVLNKHHKKKKRWKRHKGRHRKKKKRWKRHKGRHTRIRTIADTLSLAFSSVIYLGIFSGGVLILGNKFGLFSLPWVETIGIIFDWAYYIGPILIILGGCGIWGLLENRKARIVFPIAGILACLVVGTVFPGVADVLFWRGADGESMDELVKPHGFSITIGADGHRIWLHNNPKATDPNYKELTAFISQDKTNEVPYDSSKFVCADYAEMLHNNAEKAGIRAAYVCVEFQSSYLGSDKHALNAFRTVDKGLVFIDCTKYDRIVYVKVNELYQATSLSSGFGCPSMGIVTHRTIKW